MRWLQKGRALGLAAENRVRWEDAAKSRHVPERVQTILMSATWQRVCSQGVKQGRCGYHPVRCCRSNSRNLDRAIGDVPADTRRGRRDPSDRRSAGMCTLKDVRAPCRPSRKLPDIRPIASSVSLVAQLTVATFFKAHCARQRSSDAPIPYFDQPDFEQALQRCLSAKTRKNSPDVDTTRSPTLSLAGSRVGDAAVIALTKNSNRIALTPETPAHQR